MKRYLQLDALRGLFLIIMSLDHFGGIFPYVLHGRIGYISAADGFVFLSGMVAGMVYGRYHERQKLFFKSFERGVKIYRYHLATVIVLFILMNSVVFYEEYWSMKFTAFSEYSLSGLFSALILLYQPYHTDILTMYIFFIVLMPIMITLLQMKWLKAFWLFTIFIWVIGFFLSLPSHTNNESLTGLLHVDLGTFNPLCWQLLFFIGIYLGYRKMHEASFAPNFDTSRLLIASLIAVFFFLMKNFGDSYIEAIPGFTQGQLGHRFFFGGFNLGLARIIDFFAISYLVAFLLMKYKTVFRYSWLVVLGQNSIKVFTTHLITLFLFSPMIPIVMKYGIFWQSLFSLLMLLPFYIVVKKDLFAQVSLSAIRKYVSKVIL